MFRIFTLLACLFLVFGIGCKNVKVVSMNIGLGAKRCFKGSSCADCEKHCDEGCVKQLLSFDAAIDSLPTYFEEQFAGVKVGIICLQEVNTNYQGRNILDEIVQTLGEPWHYEFHSPSNGTTGNAILSSFKHTKRQEWTLPIKQGSHKRGALALKFTYGNKWLWVVNTHLGLDPAYRELQVDEIIKRYKTFDPIVPVIITGDLNIIDPFIIGSAKTVDNDDVVHYQNTIQEMIDSGLYRVPFHPNEGRPYTFHSWNSVARGLIVDYMFWLDPNGSSPTLRTLRPGPHSANSSNAICPHVKTNTRYLSDHNGIIMQHNVFGF